MKGTYTAIGIVIVLLLIAGFVVFVFKTPEAAETIKIGAILPLTGSTALLGESARDAMLLAKDQLANMKYNYEIIFEDDQLNAQLTANAVNKLVFADKVDAVLSFSSGSGNVVSPVTEQNKVIHIGVASDPNVAKGTYNFIHATPPEEEAKAWVAEAQKRGIKRIAIFSMNQQGALAITNAVKKEVIGKDLQIVSDDVFNLGERDFRTIVVKAKEKNPDIYLLHTFSPELELLTKQIKELGITTPLTSIEAFEFTEEPSLFEGYWYVQAADPTNSYISMYKAKYGKDPQAFSANTYDNVLLVAEGFEKAGDGKTIPSHDKVAAEMLNIKDFSGALGILNIGSDHIIHSQAVVRMIKAGKPVTIPISAGTIKLGSVIVLTGDAAAYGIDVKNSIGIALNEINAQGGINGKKLEVIFEDGKCTGKDAATAANKLVYVDKVKVIFGGSCSGETLSMAPITEQNKVILFSSTSSSPLLTTAGDYVFRNHPSDAFAGAQLAEVILKKYKKAAILSENTDYAQALREVFKKKISEGGGQIVADEVFDQGNKDFRTQLTKIKASSPDVIFINPQSGVAGGLAVKQARELGLNQQLYAAYFGGASDFLEQASGAAEGLIYVDLPILEPSNAKANSLLSKYKAEFEKDPVYPTFAALGYDAAYIIVDAIKSCGEGTDCIKNWLYAMDDYNGAAGKYRFDSNGDVVGVTLSVRQIVNGTVVPYQG